MASFPAGAAANAPEPHGLMTADEAAELLRFPSRNALYKAVERGHVPKPVRIGARIRWHRKDLEEFVANQRVRP